MNAVSSAKYFGVVIDKAFKFKDHITGSERRVARSVGFLLKLVHILS